MKKSDAYPSKYLSAADLKGREFHLTITEVIEEEIGRSKEPKPVVYFKEAKKGLALNKTNWSAIEKALGSDETDDWTGGRITLYPSETSYEGETVDCIRVRPKSPPKNVGDEDEAEDEEPAPKKKNKTSAKTLGIDDSEIPF